MKSYEVGAMPGTNGFTMACFEAKNVPVGTRVYVASDVAPLVEALRRISSMSADDMYADAEARFAMSMAASAALSTLDADGSKS